MIDKSRHANRADKDAHSATNDHGFGVIDFDLRPAHETNGVERNGCRFCAARNASSKLSEVMSPRTR